MEALQGDSCSVSSSQSFASSATSQGASSRKRKVFSPNMTCGPRKQSDVEDELDGENEALQCDESSKRHNHSEIEKRRRDKMNTYITQLCDMVPMCHAMSHKLDKLTVLRMAVQHLRTIRGGEHAYDEAQYKPDFVSEQEFKQLILQAADGFLFVVGCDRGRIFYVSQSVSQVLNYSQAELLGKSLFDILHPKDVAKVKEHIPSPDLMPRERLIDAKTMLPVKSVLPQTGSRLCTGARRSFFCRMKCKQSSVLKVESRNRRNKSQSSDRRYCVIQCTGYLKSWAPAKMGIQEADNEEVDSTTHLSCLVAVGRLQQPCTMQERPQQKPANLRRIEFMSRHSLDGKFLFVDQRATLVLGFLPQEMLGTSMYEYYQHEDIPHLARSHKMTLHSTQYVTTETYGFRAKNGSYVRVCSEWRAFYNPWTKDVEFLVAKNWLVTSDDQLATPAASHVSLDSFSSSSHCPGFPDFTDIITYNVEAKKIGRHIADEALAICRKGETEVTLVKDDSLTVSCASTSVPDNGHCSVHVHSSGHSTSNLGRNFALNDSSDNLAQHGDRSQQDFLMTQAKFVIAPPTSTNCQHCPTNHSEDNDEAAMAVIMSLLEADAGLGGPVDFSGIPWPLP